MLLPVWFDHDHHRDWVLTGGQDRQVTLDFNRQKQRVHHVSADKPKNIVISMWTSKLSCPPVQPVRYHEQPRIERVNCLSRDAVR
jgi:hypothetical protein